jgi:hypothetical protein
MSYVIASTESGRVACSPGHFDMPSRLVGPTWRRRRQGRQGLNVKGQINDGLLHVVLLSPMCLITPGTEFETRGDPNGTSYPRSLRPLSDSNLIDCCKGTTPRTPCDSQSGRAPLRRTQSLFGLLELGPAHNHA